MNTPLSKKGVPVVLFAVAGFFAVFFLFFVTKEAFAGTSSGDISISVSMSTSTIYPGDPYSVRATVSNSGSNAYSGTVDMYWGYSSPTNGFCSGSYTAPAGGETTVSCSSSGDSAGTTVYFQANTSGNSVNWWERTIWDTTSYTVSAPKVNGSCGSSADKDYYSAPTSNLCRSGTASASGSWSWQCLGSGGGTTASCSAYQIVDCVGSWGTCSNGSQSYTITTSAANGGLSCPSSNGATRSCGTPASCGSSNGGSFTSAPSSNLCSSGTAGTVSGSGPWSWSCNSSNGGTSASCSANLSSPSLSPTASINNSSPLPNISNPPGAYTLTGSVNNTGGPYSGTNSWYYGTNGGTGRTYLAPAGSGETVTPYTGPTGNYDNITYDFYLCPSVGSCSGAASLKIIKATPSVSWATPSSITYGTALGATQLNATASVAGTFAYTPTTGTVLNAGAEQKLSVTFTPTDSTNYRSVVNETYLTVNKASQTISFPVIPNKTTTDAPFTPTVSATSGLGVTLSIVSGPATISSNTITITGVGTVTVRATQTGNANYNAATSVDRSFTVSQPPQTLTTTVSPSGTGSISCNSTTCASSYAYGTVVNLSASPAANYVFSNWSGACTGNGACQVTMNASKSVTANFSPAAPPAPRITFARAGCNVYDNLQYHANNYIVWNQNEFPSGTTFSVYIATGENAGTYRLQSSGITGSTFTQQLRSQIYKVSVSPAFPSPANEYNLSLDDLSYRVTAIRNGLESERSNYAYLSGTEDADQCGARLESEAPLPPKLPNLTPATPTVTGTSPVSGKTYTFYTGSSVTLTARVSNDNVRDITETFQNKFLFTTPSGSSGDASGNLPLANIARGGSKNVSATITNVQPGTFNIYLRADSGAAVAERDESDNDSASVTVVVENPPPTGAAVGPACPAGETEIQSYATPGGETWSVPAGFGSVRVKLWGGGGGGGCGTDLVGGGIGSCGRSYGGGGGGYTESVLSVSEGQTFAVTVGAGGQGQTAATLATGGQVTRYASQGGNSRFGSLSAYGSGRQLSGNLFMSGGTGATANGGAGGQNNQTMGGGGGGGSGGGAGTDSPSFSSSIQALRGSGGAGGNGGGRGGDGAGGVAFLNSFQDCRDATSGTFPGGGGGAPSLYLQSPSCGSYQSGGNGAGGLVLICGVAQPDLVAKITSVSESAPPYGPANPTGAPVNGATYRFYRSDNIKTTLSGIVRNQGGVATGRGFSNHLKNMTTAAELTGSSINMTELAANTPAAGATTNNYSFPIPLTTVGTTALALCADNKGAVAESSKGNNCSHSINIVVEPRRKPEVSLYISPTGNCGTSNSTQIIKGSKARLCWSTTLVEF